MVLLVVGFVVLMMLLAAVPYIVRSMPRRSVSNGPSPAPAPGRVSMRTSGPGPAPGPVSRPASARGPATYSARMTASRRSMWDRLAAVRGHKADDDAWERMEEALLGADVGVTTTMSTLGRLRTIASEQGISDGDELIAALGTQMREALDGDRALRASVPDRPSATPVWLFVGVNGVGKTTTIGKVGHRLAGEGRRVVMAAGDTFRAAATEQLRTWASRCGAELISGSDGADPSSVVHDAISAAGARGADLVLADTAGRMQNRKNLMDELAKVRRVADREPGAVAETLLVIDATTGQNGLRQARAFAEATDVTGVVLTKLDGSAKGGIVFAVEAELGLRVKLVGLGESADDLVDFDPDRYLDALLGSPGEPPDQVPDQAAQPEGA